jgi:hypothetical protein
MAKTMLQKLGIGETDEQKTPDQKPASTEKGFLSYHSEGKFLASFFSFGPAVPKEKNRRLAASLVSRNFKFASIQNAEEVLRVLLPSGIVEDAKFNGWTLTEVVKHAHDIIEARKSEKKPIKEVADYDVKRLVNILAGLSANTTPEELLAELKLMVNEKGDAAIAVLNRMLLNENPRDKDGFVYCRRVKAK